MIPFLIVAIVAIVFINMARRDEMNPKIVGWVTLALVTLALALLCNNFKV